MLPPAVMRPFAWLCLWLWVFSPATGGLVFDHGHASLDPCQVPEVVHDATQHHVESGEPLDAHLDHCHACHVPRVHTAPQTTLVALTVANIRPMSVSGRSAASRTHIALPPRAPPTSLA